MTEAYKVPYGNCAIRGKVGNASCIISTDNLVGKTAEEFQQIYERTKEIHRKAAYSRLTKEMERENGQN